jgi:hypothetical protein
MSDRLLRCSRQSNLEAVPGDVELLGGHDGAVAVQPRPIMTELRVRLPAGSGSKRASSTRPTRSPSGPMTSIPGQPSEAVGLAGAAQDSVAAHA